MSYYAFPLVLTPRRLLRVLFAFALPVLALAPVVVAAHAPTADAPVAAPDLADRTVEALREINARLTTGDVSGALAATEHLLRATTPGTYDHAMAHLHRAQVLLTRSDSTAGDPAGATASLKHVIASGFWPRRAVVEWRYVLAQLYTQARRFDDAARELEIWIAETPVANVQGYILLVSGTIERVQERPDDDRVMRLEGALDRANEGLHLGVRPDPTLLHLKAVCLQLLERWEDAAETLEYVLYQNPGSEERWNQLLGAYLQAGHDLPAVLTIERARNHGALDTARSDVALGQLYHALNQDRQAVAAIETALRRGVDDAGAHGLFGAYLAYRVRDLPRAARLLTASEPHLVTEAQHRDFDNLREVIAGAR